MYDLFADGYAGWDQQINFVEFIDKDINLAKISVLFDLKL